MLTSTVTDPASRLKGNELKFVLAHEFLHAGLGHQGRRDGRDAFLSGERLWHVYG